ncbi:VCBS repeat-containing protein [Streptomyces albus subsp. chlorinus]|uniref:FG-GAP repeat domain-containing protein n=1 Tax=Streptomyces albus TaxID=1888 RepID=UPI001570A886|nr:VCBS repeat-containing protein [Streptomyces albus]NSC21968.1 VCBS repeat-containing protein [Streptomyces albus subsp. chlorinus]
MLRSRSRWIAAPLAAAALTLTAAGYAGAVTSPAAGAHTAGKHAAASAPCLADATTLLGDLDGDGRPDKISNPGHTGTKMTIQWGTKSGSFGSKHTVRSLVGAKKGEDVSAAVADFDNDGTLDLVVNVVKPSGGDDPSTARLAEYRPGPLARTNLKSPGAVHSDIGDMGEVRQLSVARYNDDAYPDLAVLNNAGDGQMDRDVRLSKPGGGLAGYDREAKLKYGEYGTWAEPPAMPTDGWSQFYKTCS